MAWLIRYVALKILDNLTLYQSLLVKEIKQIK